MSMFTRLFQTIKTWAVTVKGFVFRHPIALTMAVVLLVPLILLLIFIFRDQVSF